MSIRLNDRDGKRTNEEARENIDSNTAREAMMKPVVLELLRTKYPNAEIEDSGIDNSGKFIPDSDVDIEKLKHPDWLVHLGHKSFYVEAMVHSEVFWICSFKETKLRNAIEHNAQIWVLRDRYVDIYPTETCRFLLENYDIITLRKKMGSNLGVELNKYDVDSLIGVNKIRRVKWPEKCVEMLKFRYDKRSGFSVQR